MREPSGRRPSRRRSEGQPPGRSGGDSAGRKDLARAFSIALDAGFNSRDPYWRDRFADRLVQWIAKGTITINDISEIADEDMAERVRKRQR
ncbi:MAG: hypothetical protein HY394_05070 [Candidatus Diapherotrites archaeon]|nr:hypothetical protein [Candidatus Diapherotrites archaeon]